MNKCFTKVVIISFLFLNTSCSSYKEIPYFQNLKNAPEIEESINNFSAFTIQSGDILGINVSSLNPETAAQFNYNLNRANGENTNASTGNAVVGYLVDQKGDIYLPLIGAVKVSGSTNAELRQDLQSRLLKYLKEPVVNIRVLNFKVSVMGDVLRPDVYPVQNERITITEALSLAGDLNITAIRKNVLLTRELDGKRKHIRIDLTSKDLFNSPYYYLKNNDVIYVQPDKTKFATVDRSYRTASLVLSGLSILAIIASTVYR